jgi:hypothetical protein
LRFLAEMRCIEDVKNDVDLNYIQIVYFSSI